MPQHRITADWWCPASFLAVMWIASSAAASTLHVSPTGDDQATGSETKPLKTISRAAELAEPGDLVLVRAGVYRERVAPARGGKPGKPIVYRAAPGERVVIKGSEIWEPEWREERPGVFSAVPAADLFNDRSPEYLDHHNPLRVPLATTPHHREGRAEAILRERGETRLRDFDKRIVYTCGQVFVDGRWLLEVPLQEELREGTWWYDAEADRVHVGFGELDPAEVKVELTTRRRLFAPKRRGLGHIVVEGFVFEHCGNQYPVNFWMTDENAQKGAVGTEAGHHWVIRRNVIRHAKTFALDVGRVDRHSDRDSSYDNLVEQNYLMDNGSAGVLSNGSIRLVIRDNVIVRNNRLRFLGVKRWEQAAVKCHHFVDGLVEGNYLADNHDTYGVWLDNQFPGARVTRNVIHGNGRAGVFLEMSDYAFDSLLVDHNVIFDNTENAIYIHDASGGTFVNNLLANTRDTPEYGQAVYIRQVTERTRSGNHTFVGNLMIGNARNVEVNYPAAKSGPQRFDGNVYDVLPGDRGFVVNNRSARPSPWTEEGFVELVSADLGRSKQPGALFLPTNDKARMTLGEWRGFWAKHGQKNDKHSVLGAGSRVDYDSGRQVLTLDIRADLAAASATGWSPAAAFPGEPFRGGRNPPPGPYPDLRAGVQEISVWEGLPPVAKDALPEPSWTR